jgi:signal transduction histidine kinase
LPTDVQPSPSTGSEPSGVAAQVRQAGHDLRNLLTIFIGVTESLEALPRREPPVEDCLTLLRALGERLQELAGDLRDISRQATPAPECDAGLLARELSGLEPGFGPLAHAYRAAPLLRASEGDVARLWTVVVLGAQRLGGFSEVPKCEVVSGTGCRYAFRLEFSFARSPLPCELRTNLEAAARHLGARLTLGTDDSSVSVDIPVA